MVKVWELWVINQVLGAEQESSAVRESDSAGEESSAARARAYPSSIDLQESTLLFNLMAPIPEKLLHQERKDE